MKNSPPSNIKDEAAAWVVRSDAGLAAAEQAELQDWLEADPRHRAAFSRLRGSWGALDRPHLAGAADELLQEIELRVERRRKRTMTAAAAAICLLLIGAVWQTHRPVPAQSAEAGASNAVVVVPERRVLPDGSIVDIRAGADLQVQFTPTMRRIELLHGQAHFQVTKDPSRPFVVETGSVNARAVGTAFSVDAGAAEVAVLVTEGRVALDVPELQDSSIRVALPDDAANHGPSAHANTVAIISAGNRIVVPRATPEKVTTAAVSAAELDDLMAWRAARVEFSGTTLADAVGFLNRHASGTRPVQFVVGDPAIGPYRISGLFRIDKTEAFVHLLKNGFGVEAEEMGDGRIVLRQKKPE